MNPTRRDAMRWLSCGPIAHVILRANQLTTAGALNEPERSPPKTPLPSAGGTTAAVSNCRPHVSLRRRSFGLIQRACGCELVGPQDDMGGGATGQPARGVTSGRVHSAGRVTRFDGPQIDMGNQSVRTRRTARGDRTVYLRRSSFVIRPLFATTSPTDHRPYERRRPGCPQRAGIRRCRPRSAGRRR